MPKEKEETSVLVAFGDTVKALPDGRVGGYLARFTREGDYDVTADRFDVTTDFGLGENATLPVLYNHGLDVKIGRRRIGSGATRVDDAGLWVEAQLKLRDEYEKKVWELAQQGKLGWSSGAAAHTVERANEAKGALVTQWFIAEASLTPIPAEPRNTVVALKSLSVSDLSAEDAGKASREGQTSNTSNSTKQGVIEMDEKDIIALLEKREAEKAAAAKALADAEAAKAAQAEALKTMVQEAVAATLSGVPVKPTAGKAVNVNTKTDAGKAVNVNTKTEKGFANDAVKGFVHWIITGRKNGALIPATFGDGQGEISNDPAVKAAMQGQTDSEGGYAVPDDFYNQVISKRDQVSVMDQVGCVAMPTTLDKVLVPTEGTAATKFVVTAEEGSYDQNEPTLGQVAITVYKFTKLIKISEELEADAKANFGAWLQNVWGRAYGLARNYYLVNVAANGSSQPQSVVYGLVAGSAYTSGTASQTATTSAEWKAFFYGLGSAYSDRQVLLMRKSTLAALTALSGNPFQFTPTQNIDTSTPMRAGTIDQIPIYLTDDMPAQAAGVYHACLFNPDFYGIAEREGIVVVRNPYLYQASGQIGLFARVRFGGALLQSAGGLLFASKA